MFDRRFRAAGAAALLAAMAAPPASAQIFGAVLPQARSTTPDNVRTAFASIVNAGSAAAANCKLQLPGTLPQILRFSYQTTDANNVPTGAANTPATIPAGGRQNFLFSVNPTSAGAGSIGLEFVCDGLKARQSATVNDFILQSNATQAADIIPVAVTQSGDGVMQIPSAGGATAMSAAAVNIGTQQNLIVAAGNPYRLVNGLPATIQVAQTDANGNIITGPAVFLENIDFPTNTPRFFAVFATGLPDAGIPNNPEHARVVLRFLSPTDLAVRGQTSVAITAPPPAGATGPIGIYDTVGRLQLAGTEIILIGNLIVASPTEAMFFSQTYDSQGGYLQIVMPLTAAVNGATLTATSQRVYFDQNGLERFDGSTASSGTFTPGTGIFYASAGTNGLGQAFTAETQALFSSLNFMNGTLADITGTWTIQNAAALAPSEVPAGTLTVSAQGAVTGTYTWLGSNCQITGQVTDPAGKPDILRVQSLIVTGPGCTFNGSGHAIKRGLGVMLPAHLGGTSGDYYTVVVHDPNLSTGGEVLHLRRN